jgi:hypothetical protein
MNNLNSILFEGKASDIIFCDDSIRFYLTGLRRGLMQVMFVMTTQAGLVKNLPGRLTEGRGCRVVGAMMGDASAEEPRIWIDAEHIEVQGG